jgi:uncharacterized BrkB/YihY/UPF0761 family membrane protein
MDLASNTSDPIKFIGTAVGLGSGGWVLGNGIERIVGSGGILVRCLANALVLYGMYVFLPRSITSHFQSTLPGILFCASFFNAQKWDTKKLL